MAQTMSAIPLECSPCRHADKHPTLARLSAGLDARPAAARPLNHRQSAALVFARNSAAHHVAKP
eukprot:359832-Chlamydomonas_euryale.AAC.13